VNSAPGAPWRLEVYASLASTSDLCRRRAAEGEPAGLAVLALRQTAGRGSRGRSWSSPRGSLSLSALLRPEGRAKEAGQWALLAGLAMLDGLASFLAEPSALALKWPNDVTLDGRKLAGILIDSAADRAGRLDWLVIGFGANLAEAPALADRPAAALAEAGATPEPEAAAAAVLGRLEHWRAIEAREGFAAVRAAWAGRAHPPGTRLRLRLPGRDLDGDFAGLTETGGLVLRTAAGLGAHDIGEVLLPGV
jgi:BirA family transcriptional regulator, biotin operon repressor / biotin---[acetyl-CoA-carboxylase] ligase